MSKYGLILILIFLAFSKLSAQDPCVKSTEGKEFWFGFMENRNHQVPQFPFYLPIVHYTEITLVSIHQCKVDIYIGKSALPSYSETVYPNIPLPVRIPWQNVEAIGSETVQNKAIHLVSDNPLNLYALNWCENSADVAVIFPNESIGNEYYTMCYTPNVDAYFDSYGIEYYRSGRNSEFLIVATEDNTKVTITPTKNTDKGNLANIAFTVSLNKGELYQVQSLNHANLAGQGDLTGSYITSDRPVAVYSGSLATTVPVGANIDAWDHLYEQMPPLGNWGRRFVTVPLKGRSKDVFRILASRDNTHIKIGDKKTVELNKGAFSDFELSASEPTLIDSDQPVLLAQYMISNSIDRPPGFTQYNWDGDPFMVLVSPVDQTIESVTFVAYDSQNISNKYYVNVVTRDDYVNNIMLDNGSIPFKPLPNSGYSFAQINIQKGPHNLTSTAAGQGFIAYTYGYGSVESYGYGVGFNLNVQLDLGGDIHFVKDTIVLCNGATKTLDAGSQFSTYLWNTGETTPKITVSKKGYYEVTASTLGGCTLTDGIHVLESNPLINLGKDSTFCNSQWLDTGEGFTSWQWSTNETTQKILAKTSGLYSVLATNKFGCQAKDTIKIGFGQVPKLNLSKLDTLSCGNKTTTVNISADKGSYTLYGKDPAVVTQNLTATVPQFGTYLFIFTATDESGCAADTTFTIGFIQIPSANFNINDTTCYGYSVEAKYTGDAEIARSKFTWVFANDTLARGTGKNSVQLAIAKNQINTKLHLKIEDQGCANSHEITEVKVIPDLSFTVSDTLVCRQKTVAFSASNSEKVVDYYWDWGDGYKDHNGKDASHLYQTSGRYDIQLTATTDKKCSNTVTKKNVLFVAQTPTVDFSISDKKCTEVGVRNLLYTGTGDEYAKYIWDLSGFKPGEVIKDPGNSKGPLEYNLRSQPKTEIGLQVISKDGCSSENRKWLLQRKPDFSVFVSDSAGCVPLLVEFMAVTNDAVDQVDYNWNFGNGDTRTGTSVPYTFTSAKPYDPEIIAASKTTGCSDTLVKALWINVFPRPQAAFTVQNPLRCLNDPFVFKAFDNGPGVEYSWNLGDGSQPNGIEVNHKYTAEGHYDVSLTVTSSQGCMDQSQVKSMVYAAPIPDVGFSIDPETCLNPGSNSLNYLGSATDKDKFNWDLSGLDPSEIIQLPGNSSGPLIFNLLHKPLTTISLQVVSQYGCYSENKQLKVKRKPVFSLISDNRVGCPPLEVGLKANTTDPIDKTEYHWDFGDGGTTIGPEVKHIYLFPDQYYDLSVKVLSKVTGCSASLEEVKYILVYPSPKAGFSFEPETVWNDQSTVTFSDLSIDADRYFWDFGDGTNAGLKNPVHKYEKMGILKVMQTVYNQYDCFDSTTKELVVAMSKIFTPNAFSPNADNLVDRVFRLYAEGIIKDGYHLKILSRWNDVVFECKNEIKGWDGTLLNGSYAQAGNYVWILEFTDFLGKQHRQMGTVTLLY